MPEIAQSFTVAFPRAQVWHVFQDPRLVAGCMPGAALEESPDRNRLRGQMRVKLGPITAAFAGEAELLMDDAACTGIIRGQGFDRKNNSRARADVGFSLADRDAGTRVEIKVDFVLTGMLAQFSRGAIVQEIAQRLTNEFAHNLTAAMEAQKVPATPPEAEGGPSTPTTDEPATARHAAPAHELNLVGLLWSVLTAWIGRTLAKLAGHKNLSGTR